MASSRFDLLRGLSNEQIDTLLALGRRRAVSQREQLAPRSDSVFLLLEGEVDLSISVVLDGRKQHVRVERARPGEMLGWMSLIPSSPWQRVAHAHGEAIVLEFPRPELMALLASDPALASAIHSNLAARAATELHAAWLLHLQREFDRFGARRTSAA
ncbi:MAG TPA: cyclic nucleotide-binding domain-containing protein [Anaeromyxobacteraceae bacterium]|nr:cyclic nucleotide-binding domain-containing protein [Anaeromyxobacteraceae bacterium]